MQASAPCQSKKENKIYRTQASPISCTVLRLPSFAVCFGVFFWFFKHIHEFHYNSQVINTWLFIMARKLPYSEDFLAIGRQESAS